MLVSYKWLQEYFEEKLPDPKDLVEVLTLKAFEIEGVEKVKTVKGEAVVIDVDVLPNRAHDCLCHYGIAKEISAITGLEMKEKNGEGRPLEKEPQFETDFEIENSSDMCRRYMACELKNVKITESPDDLKAKMEAMREKSINSLVDITNIVMFETGQPMHAFDVDKLSGKKIGIRTAKNDEKITTLDKKEVDLDEKVLLIADEQDPLAIAGIKGGKKPEVNEQTTNILLESANFDPTNVRKTSRRTGIGTNSSKRFENEITPEIAEFAMNRAVELIIQYTATEKTEVSNKIDFYPKKWRPYRTGISVEEVSSLLGVDFSEKEISEALIKLDFKYELLDSRKTIVEEAESLLDRPYKYGASVFFDAPERFDCSAFVSYVYSLSGYSIPRMAVDQFVFSKRIKEEDLLLGDLIFVNSGDSKRKIDFESKEYLPGTKVVKGVDHIGIYVGNGNVIHATEKGESAVVEEVIDQSESFKNIVGYGRIIKSVQEGNDRFAVEVPVERLDIKNGPDLIEEVGRILGYDKIIDEPVETKITSDQFIPKVNRSYQLSIWLKNILTNLGFSEIITYSFVEKGEIEPLKPIAEDKAFVRPSLIEGMEKALKRNINNADLLALDHIKIFEIGKVFKRNDEKIQENLMLAIGVENKPGVKSPTPEFLITKAVGEINDALGIDIAEIAEVEVGQDANKIEINLDKILESDIFETNIEEKLDSIYPKLPKINEETKYMPISPYPFMLRDLAVWLPKEVRSEEILKIVETESGGLLINHKLFDVYEKDDKVSYAHRLVFQSDEKTLTDEEANEIMKKISARIINNGWEVR